MGCVIPSFFLSFSLVLSLSLIHHLSLFLSSFFSPSHLLLPNAHGRFVALHPLLSHRRPQAGLLRSDKPFSYSTGFYGPVSRF